MRLKVQRMMRPDVQRHDDIPLQIAGNKTQIAKIIRAIPAIVKAN
jgi:hypothetical protein